MENSPTPQFGTAEYASQSGASSCRTCSLPIVGQYYRVNNALTCAICAEKALGLGPKDSNSIFARSLMFGAAGAILGLILYAAVGIITGLAIGYVSIAVGYVVGRAVLYGSRGMGGRRYQIAAALLTYAAVSMAAVPIALTQYGKEKGAATTKSEASVSSPADPSPAAKPAAVSDEEESPLSVTGLGIALGYLALLGLASPVLELTDPIQGLIGLVILIVGIRIAWKMTAGTGISVRGPYNA